MGNLSADQVELKEIIAAVSGNYDGLGALIRTLPGSTNPTTNDINIRTHYLPFRNGKPMTGELLDHIRSYICNFALSRSEIEAVHSSVQGCTPQETMLAYNKLRDAASDLFIKAQKSTNRNGECGELLLYLLIEWVLEAPQILAKMALKTNAQMPVHGSDGIHVKLDSQSGELMFIWGEAKLHGTVAGALGSAIKSISTSLKYEQQKEDINLVKRYFDMSGFPSSAKSKILDYLNPLNESYSQKVDVSACLIGFDFDGFSKLNGFRQEQIEAGFCSLLTTEIVAATTKLSEQLASQGISHHRMEIFFLPVDSVDQLRIDFQNLIGWKS